MTLVSATLHVRRLFLAILAISFFWAMGAVLAAQFPPLVKNVLYADQSVATLFLVSDSASWLTSVTLDISGGRIML